MGAIFSAQYENGWEFGEGGVGDGNGAVQVAVLKVTFGHSWDDCVSALGGSNLTFPRI